MNRQQFHDYWRVSQLGAINRQVVTRDGLKGLLIIAGVIIGLWVATVRQPRIVLIVGLATCVAMAVSGAWHAYRSQAKRRKRILRHLEQAMLSDLSDTEQARTAKIAVVVIAVLSGLCRFMAGMLALIPLFFDHLFPSIVHVYISSLGLTLIAILGLKSSAATS